MINSEKNRCEAGCKMFTGGEIKHHKDCIYYPDSLSYLYDKRLNKEKEIMEPRRLHKAKRMDNGEWVEGYYSPYFSYQNIVSGNMCVIESDHIQTKESFFPIDPATLCQCIGSDNKQFEHDPGVPRFEYDVESVGIDCDLYIYLWDGWRFGGYPLYNRDQKQYLEIWLSKERKTEKIFGIIGNIHD